MRNNNTLIGRYPGADGMKTGFICASGFNVVATATRNGKQADRRGVRLASPAVRAEKAAQLFEQGFAVGALSWLMPSLGTVDALQPIAAAPPNLRDEMCGKHRKRPAAEEDDDDRGAARAATSNSAYAVILSKPARPHGKPGRCSDRAARRAGRGVCRARPSDQPDVAARRRQGRKGKAKTAGRSRAQPQGQHATSRSQRRRRASRRRQARRRRRRRPNARRRPRPRTRQDEAASEGRRQDREARRRRRSRQPRPTPSKTAATKPARKSARAMTDAGARRPRGPAGRSRSRCSPAFSAPARPRCSTACCATRRSPTPPSSSTSSARSGSIISWSRRIEDGVMLLSTGCLCCTVRGDLVTALEKLLRGLDNGRMHVQPRGIETTGLADPAPVLHTAMVHPYLVMRFRLDGVVTVVDAVNGAATLDAHRRR